MGGKRKERVFEIGRDEGVYNVARRLRYVDNWGWESPDEMREYVFCTEAFDHLTGIRLKPGEKRRYKLVEVK